MLIGACADAIGNYVADQRWLLVSQLFPSRERDPILGATFEHRR